MAKSNEVVLRIIGDSSSAQTALAETEARTGAFSGKMKGILGAIGGVALAKGVFDFAKSSADAYTEAQGSADKLAYAFKQFPALNDSNVDSFNKLNTALEKKTKFDDDTLASGQAVLAQFGLTGKQVEQLTPLLADYAARTGKSIPDAADALGKAMLGKGRALQEIGIKFKDTGSLAGNFEQTVSGLRTQVGGFAEQEGKTAAGRAEILHNQFGELEETVGSKLVPALTTLSGWLINIVEWFSNLNPGILTAIGVVVGLVGAVVLIHKAMETWTIIQGVFNAVMAANPIVLVVIALAALVAGIVWAYGHVAWFRDGVQAAFSFLVAVAHWLGAAFSTVWDGIVQGFVWVVNNIKALANWVVEHAINPAIDGINLLIRGYNLLPGHTDVALLSHLPKFHSGGVIPGPVGTEVPIMALAGEEVTPIGGRGGSGALIVNLTVQGSVIGANERELGDVLVARLNDHFARGGALSNGRGGTLAPGS